MRLTMTNNEIYQAYYNLMENFNDVEQKFPIRVNFYLQKNKRILIECVQEIETSRMEIINRYGKPMQSDPSQYQIEKENIEVAQNELNDLFNLEQDIDLYLVDIDDFPADMSLTGNQMDALLFMINN